MEPTHIPFPSIGGLHNVRATNARYGFVGHGTHVSYRSKIKLHGTNRGVTVWPDGRVIGQSRETLLCDQQDVDGFEQWLRPQATAFEGISGDAPLAVFGEWCGDRIKKKAAICRIDTRIFAIFAVQVGLASEMDLGRSTYLMVDPGEIRMLLGGVADLPEVRILPWIDGITAPCIDFDDQEEMERQAEALSRDVGVIAEEDPWVASEFGVKGPGEGVVCYPVHGAPFQGSVWSFSTFAFKAKGAAHQVNKTPRPVVIDPQKLASAEAFADMFVTEARLEQGISRFGTDARTEDTRAFLEWILDDVTREGAAEIASNGIEARDLSRAVLPRARSWFLARARERPAPGLA
jgi:hypothetical protein